jgi:hypothetical protein
MSILYEYINKYFKKSVRERDGDRRKGKGGRREGEGMEGEEIRGCEESDTMR